VPNHAMEPTPPDLFMNLFAVIVCPMPTYEYSTVARGSRRSLTSLRRPFSASGSRPIVHTV
jgi:hypothetical protein